MWVVALRHLVSHVDSSAEVHATATTRCLAEGINILAHCSRLLRLLLLDELVFVFHGFGF